MSTEQVPKQKIKVTISGIKADLESGKDRAAIKEKYGLSHQDMKHLFQNPKLKNLKPKKEFVPNFELEDDEPDVPAPTPKAKSKAAIVSDAVSIPTPKEEWGTEKEEWGTEEVATATPVAPAPVPVPEPAPVATVVPAPEPQPEPKLETQKGLW